MYIHNPNIIEDLKATIIQQIVATDCYILKRVSPTQCDGKIIHSSLRRALSALFMIYLFCIFLLFYNKNVIFMPIADYSFLGCKINAPSCIYNIYTRALIHHTDHEYVMRSASSTTPLHFHSHNTICVNNLLFFSHFNFFHHTNVSSSFIKSISSFLFIAP